MAYVKAVASAAGFAVTEMGRPVDNDGVDVLFSGVSRSGATASPRLEAQIKCTERDIVREDGAHFPLHLKNYDDLRLPNFHVPRILVVVIVPQDERAWVNQTTEAMVIRRCAYWASLQGMEESINKETVTITLPTNQVLSVEALRALMNGVQRG